MAPSPSTRVRLEPGVDEEDWQRWARSEFRPCDRIAALLEVRDQRFLAEAFQFEIVEQVRAVAARRLQDPELITDILLRMKYERQYVAGFLRRLSDRYRAQLVREARDYMIRKLAQRSLVLHSSRKADCWVRR